MAKRKATKKAAKKGGVRVTGRSVAYIQAVGKKGRLGKAQPVVLTTVQVKK